MDSTSKVSKEDPTTTIVEGPFDARNISTASSEINFRDLPIDLVAFSIKSMNQQAGVELAAKFLFICALVAKMALATSHCYTLLKKAEASNTIQTRSLIIKMGQPAFLVQGHNCNNPSIITISILERRWH